MNAHAERHETLHHTCPFCRILSGQEAQRDRIFYEDGRYVAMLVRQPRSRGHFIVFPKAHRSQLSEMKNEFGVFFSKVHELAEDATQKLGAPAYELKLNNNIYLLEDDPDHVGHIHMHVVPRYTPDSDDVTMDPEYYSSLMWRLKTR